MKEQDKWLDERIRRGIQAWSPELPKSLDQELNQRMAAGKQLKDNKTKSGVLGKWAAIAAALILGVILLMPLFRTDSTEMINLAKFPKVQNPFIAPPALAITVPKMPITVPSGKRLAPIVPSYSPENSVSKPRQLDIIMNIPDKNITIVWTQLEDFDLLSRKRKGNGL